MTPNVPAHRRRANDVRLSTEARSRRSVQPVGSATFASQCSSPKANDVNRVTLQISDDTYAKPVLFVNQVSCLLYTSDAADE